VVLVGRGAGAGGALKGGPFGDTGWLQGSVEWGGGEGGKRGAEVYFFLWLAPQARNRLVGWSPPRAGPATQRSYGRVVVVEQYASLGRAR